MLNSGALKLAISMHGEEYVNMAIDIALKANKPNMTYIDGILKNWRREGYPKDKEERTMENKNMTTCKAYSKEIAKGVKKCPNCGKDQRNFFMRHKVISVIAIFIVLDVICSATDGSNKDASNSTTTNAQVKQEEPSITVSAVDLAKAYEYNEVNADK